MKEKILGGPGLTVNSFFQAIEDRDVKRFLDTGVLSVLNAIFGGQISGSELRRVAETTIDFGTLLGEKVGRKLVLDLIPERKQSELEDWVDRSIHPADSENWTEKEVHKLRDFFNLIEERIVSPPERATYTISPKYGLFDHQREAVHELMPLLAKDERRAVLHLPTGVGKTRTAMHVVAEWLRRNDPSIVVWLASGRELLEQATLAFQEAWSHLGTRSLQVGKMWGKHTPNLNDFKDGFLVVGLAKGWAVVSRTNPDWAARLSSRIRLVVFDEAHQSIAPTYRRITEELTLNCQCALLGLTATPGRTWNDIDKDGELAEFFSRNKVMLKVPGENSIEYLIENRFLARPIFRTLLSQPGACINDDDLFRISEGLDIPKDIVASLSMSPQYVTAVLEAITQLISTGHRRVLVFAATVDHAQVLTAILILRDIQCDIVTGLTPQCLRERAICNFKSDDQDPRILINFGVLTTGFDAPKASAVVIARPTRSLVLYSQMVGRAIRGPKAGGTDTCEVITVVDPKLRGFGDIAKAFLNWEDVW